MLVKADGICVTSGSVILSGMERKESKGTEEVCKELVIMMVMKPKFNNREMRWGRWKNVESHNMHS